MVDRRRSATVSLPGLTVGFMHDSYYAQVSRPQLIGLYGANLASALILGLFVALPITGVTFMIALGASCLADAGCEIPTALDTLVQITALGSWAVTTVYACVHQIRTLHKTVRVRPSLKLRLR